MGLSSLTSTISTEVKWNAQITQTGGIYNPISNPGDIRKNQNLGTGSVNTAVGGADQFFSFQVPISAAAAATIDLYAMTNIMGQTASSIVRIKGYQIRVLSGADDPSITPTPTATSTATITNNGVALPTPLDFATGGSGLTVVLTVTGGVVTGVSISAAGSGYPKSSSFLAVPAQAGASGAVIAVTTNVSGVPTTVTVVAGGTGYTGATVPTVVMGQYTVLTGGTHMYFDPAAGGFCAVSATQRNLKVTNNDPTNAITVEVDVIGGSS